MKIHKVRFQNLNSLVGTWEIDFTDSHFATDGIFAITGPTGAGKTTILDAICLALYGRTPRLDSVTKTSNEIMSRQTGECFAEVDFETQKGHFLCYWSQHRAGKKPDGKLQDAEHEISDAKTGHILKAKLRGVAKEIEAATGMDFERFVRSMLLAQGRFAEFLQASGSDRAAILEQITGTDVYSEISKRVHERNKHENDLLKQLETETSSIAILDAEQENEIQLSLEKKEKEKAALDAGVEQTKAAIDWLKKLCAMEQKKVSLAAEIEKLQAEMKEFQPSREKLERATKAATLDGVYNPLRTLRSQCTNDLDAMLSCEAMLPELEKTVRKKVEALAAANEKVRQAKAAQKEAAQTLQKVRSMDQALATQKSEIERLQREGASEAAAIQALTTQKSGEEAKLAVVQEDLNRAEHYLEENARDSWLVENLAGVEEKFRSLLDLQSKVAKHEAELAAANQDLVNAKREHDEIQKQTSARLQTLAAAKLSLQQEEKALASLLGARLLREYRAERDGLQREHALRAKIASLEDLRAELSDGCECPLCGSTEHPFAKGNIPALSETQTQIAALENLIRKAEDHEAAISKHKENEAAAQQSVSEADKQVSDAAQKVQSRTERVDRLRADLETSRAEFAQRKEAVQSGLTQIGVDALCETEVEALQAALRERHTAWTARVREKASVEEKKRGFEKEIATLAASIEAQSKALAQKQARLCSLQENFVAVGNARRELFGEKDADTEERHFENLVFAAERKAEEARNQHDVATQNRNSAQAEAEVLRKRIHEQTPERERCEATFAAALVPLGFASEEEFCGAALPTENREALARQAKDFDQRETEQKTLYKKQQEDIDTEKSRVLTDETLDVLTTREAEQEGARHELQETISGLHYQLRTNDEAKERVKEKQVAIEAQKKECTRWNNLDQLIGSADGKKYRNFAQALTFEQVVAHANQQLQKMMSRYLLVQSQSSSEFLELQVIDTDQAGERRSTKNLSGGESFIVSLSLALGLSQMTSANVRVDSLFLDEGFGTLDEDALETALTTLSELRQSGKLIGIISHVAALKERIATQIQVTPKSGGQSQLSGPGCKQTS